MYDRHEASIGGRACRLHGVTNMSKRLLSNFTIALLMVGSGFCGAMLQPAAVKAGPALAGFFGVTSCSSPNPCIGGNNSGTGPGVVGTAKKGIGVKGTSVSNAGVSGTSASGPGVNATSTNGVGLSAQSVAFRGVYGTSSKDDGVDGITNNPSLSTGVGHFGMQGSDASLDGGTLNAGVEGASSYGIGVKGQSAYFAGGDFNGGYPVGGTYFPALSLTGYYYLIAGCPYVDPCDTTSASFTLAGSGDLNDPSGIAFFNALYTNGFCSAGCATSQNHTARRVRFYTPRESLPTVEDFGEAQLVAGQAHVVLDRTFANTIEVRANYLVFLTPEGDSRGLYVSDKNARSFDVRESQGGRSTLTFQYRIVAKPYGDSSKRLPMVTVQLPARHGGRP